MTAKRQQVMTATFRSLYGPPFHEDKLAKTLRDFDEGKIGKNRRRRRLRKAKGVAPVTLDVHDVITARWLVGALSWVPASKRNAIERFAKRVGA